MPIQGHKGKKHVKKAAAPVVAPVKTSTGLERVNALYLESVKPIFKVKCFDCHATAESSLREING